jgi:F0F1-type ATP synthase assembly protein I
MKHLHYTHCLVGIAFAVVLLIALGVSASTLGFLAVFLACPLMMFVMMRTMGDSHASSREDETVDHEVPR